MPHDGAGHAPSRREPYGLLIIGAGPAGLAAARGGAAAGVRVALIESHHIGGNCLHEGCIPSKTILRSAQLIADLRNAPHYGVGRQAEVTVDFAAVMARMRRVRDRILRVDSAARLHAEGIDLHVGRARFVGADAVDVDGTRLRFRKALIATGSRPLMPDIDGLAGAGYLTNETVFELTQLPPSLLVIGGGPLGCELAQAFTNAAEASARIVVRNALLRGRQRISALTVPWCTYTDPQVAHVGLYVRQARAQGTPGKTYTVPMHDVVRAITDGDEDGFVKVHVREGTDRILGATIVGRCAGEMINNISLAMVAGLGLRRLASVIHAYPTQGEAVRQAAQACAQSLAAAVPATNKDIA